jgi:EAL domain-containing protein (putative c-di-GMP-specific phosphodiesterase class I)
MNIAQSILRTIEGLNFVWRGRRFQIGTSIGLVLLDSIKIDGHCIRHLDRDPVDRALVESLVGAGESLGLLIEAEMVETDAIARQLNRMGVNHLQGFSISSDINGE